MTRKIQISPFDRSLKILARDHPEIFLKLIFKGDDEAVHVALRENPEVNLAEKRLDYAFLITMKSGEKLVLLLEFLFLPERGSLRDYYIKHGLMTAISDDPVILVVFYFSERGSKDLESKYAIEAGGLSNSFQFEAVNLNDYKKQIHDGKLRELAPFLPILEGRANEELLSEVKEMVLREPDSKKRANLFSIAMTIACRYMDKDLLKEFFKEEMEMLRQASFVEEWIEEGVQKGIQTGIQTGTLQKAREDVVEILEVRFEIAPASIAMTINEIDDPSVLKMLHKKAATANSLEEFKGALKRVMS